MVLSGLFLLVLTSVAVIVVFIYCRRRDRRRHEAALLSNMEAPSSSTLRELEPVDSLTDSGITKSVENGRCRKEGTSSDIGFSTNDKLAKPPEKSSAAARNGAVCKKTQPRVPHVLDHFVDAKGGPNNDDDMYRMSRTFELPTSTVHEGRLKNTSPQKSKVTNTSSERRPALQRLHKKEAKNKNIRTDDVRYKSGQRSKSRRS